MLRPLHDAGLRSWTRAAITAGLASLIRGPRSLNRARAFAFLLQDGDSFDYVIDELNCLTFLVVDEV